MIQSLLIVPIIGVIFILITTNDIQFLFKSKDINNSIKKIALSASIINMLIASFIWLSFDYTENNFQLTDSYIGNNFYNIYLGIDGLSLNFILLTTFIIPISILSNWNSIKINLKSYLVTILILETLLLAVFLVLDLLLFYIFFESTLPPLFILIGLFGSKNKIRASFYLFLYTLLGSLFLLLAILSLYSIIGTTDFNELYKSNINFNTQKFLFIGIIFAFAVKTPSIFLNSWLLKAHVESPLGGSIILAAIVLKLSLYGILRLILPIIPKSSLDYTVYIFLIGVITIIYASISTIRTIDIKELIAYSSVSHAAVYFIGAFSNVIQGIQGSILLGIAHGFVSPALFICAGGILYDRSHTRIITFYRGMTQIMPLFSLLFFLFSLANCGVPLTLNFMGEFMSLYGTFERLIFMGILASTSIIFSAAYSIYMYNRIAFGGRFSPYFSVNISDLTKREFILLTTLLIPTIVMGINSSIILNSINYITSGLLYSIKII